MIAETLHREADSVLEVIVNCILTAVSVNDNFIEEALVSAFAEVLGNSREQPESVVSTVGRMSCFLCVNAVRVVLVRAGLVACIVVELNKRESAAVVYLSGEHEADLLCCHFRIEVDDTLYILYCVTVAVAVSQAAVDE